MKTLKIEKEKIDLNTGQKVAYTATVSSERDNIHKTYSLLYEGYISEWKEVKK